MPKMNKRVLLHCKNCTFFRNNLPCPGITFLGAPIVVEPSVTSSAHRKSGGQAKVMISNVASHVGINDLEPLLSQYHHIQSCEKISSRDNQTQTILVTFESNEQAQQAVNELNGTEFEGLFLKAELRTGGGGGGMGGGGEEKRGGRGGGRPRGPTGFPLGGGAGAGGGARQTDFPLRILVQSDMVGAIIGRQGSTIRQITQQSRARVDVHRKDNVGSLEKAITIYGNPENCTNACKRILEVMKQEATTNNKGEITLKVLAHNNLIGRIIGKAGNTIKRIMQETDTKITVSSINDINSFNLERIITVKGSIDNMSKAESMISSKLRQSYENDLQAMAPQSMMFPGLHPMAMMATSGMGYGGRGGGYQGGLYSGAYPPVYQPIPPASHAPDAQETTYLYIPNNAVGAIIGTKGSHIRNMIRFSGASVKIAPLEGEKMERESQQAERRVTIVGSPESQWKAQYLIFEKMREEGFVSGSDDVRLTVEILVPSSQVGRIIGKGGQNVRELQRVTGSIIKLPEQGSAGTHDDETTVHIIGAFFSVQSAQRRIRAMVSTGGAGGQGSGGPGGARGGGLRGASGGGPGAQQPPQQQQSQAPQLQPTQ
ncbi:IGF-II mRNA-binding protein isoform X4 [Rhodnius prolixus]|uniref:IGF-II mRNA-binding protein isoform X4 n=1 Tax=Rhodnius prolixus TaxID=13249 RepID=UPI003D189819